MEYKEAVDYLYNLQRFGIKLGLINTISLLEIVGNPHKRFRSIHIAGTNGKGSTAAMMASILQSSGLKVGLYTSPHLVSFTERIRINNVPISEERVAYITSTLKSKILTHNHPLPTFFEFTTVMAFKYFAEENVDIAVVEVGMGGRLDATNVITPLVSIITNISYDHQEFLGKTLTEIAREKAGIIKKGIPVVMADSFPEVNGIIEERCKNTGSKLYKSGRDFRVEERLQTQDSRLKTQVFDYYGIKKIYQGLEIPLLGAYQIMNASLSIATTEIINNEIKMEEKAVREGLRDTIWEARLEIIGRNPTILLDGAHNEGAAQYLRKALEKIFLPEHDRLFLIVGLMKDKDIRKFLSVLAPLAWELIVTAPDYERAASTSFLAMEAERYNQRVKAIGKVSDALDYAVSRTCSNDLICITGSLYAVGEIKGIGKSMERLRV